MRLYRLACLTALTVQSVKAIFQDEAYQIDYHEALLGIPQPHTTFFHKPHTSSNASLLYSVSDKAVLGAINPRDGSLVWRQFLSEQLTESTPQAFLTASQKDGQITSGCGETVSSWDASNGKQVWTYDIKDQSKVIGLQIVPAGDGNVQDSILLTQSRVGNEHHVKRLTGDKGEQVWHYKDTDTSADAEVSIATSAKHVYYVTKSSGLLSGGKVKVTVLDITTGKQVKDYSVSADSTGLGSAGSYIVASGSEAPLLISSEKPYKTVKINVLGNSKVLTITLEDKSEEVQSLQIHAVSSPIKESYFLIHVSTAGKQWAEIYHLNRKSGDAKKVYSLPATAEKSAFAASSVDSKTFFTRVTETEVSVYSSESHGHLGRWPRNQLASSEHIDLIPFEAVAEVVSKNPASVAVRLAITSPNGNWYLIRNGDMQWSRPEFLAYTTLAAWENEIKSDPLVQELAAEISSNPVSAYLHRLSRHIQELIGLPKYLLELPKNILQGPADQISTRQNLIGSKSVILVTSRNQLVAMNAAGTGEILWQANLQPQLAKGTNIRSLSTQEGRITMYVSDGSVIVANVADGSVIEKKDGKISVTRLIELPGHPAPAVVKVDDDGVPHLASDFAPAFPEEGSSIVTINKKGEALGWSVGTTIENTWTIQPPAGSKIISAVGRPDHDPIASIGKVLGDRSVLYKYVSPNLVLLTAASPNYLTIYLVEAVTGTILYTATHEGLHSASPIPSIISENWFAYAFTSHNTAANTLSTEIIISELYESSLSNERNLLSTKTGNYSTFAADSITPPHVISAAYTIAEPISELSVTQTAQGITSRNILAFLPNSNAIASIPRHILDARRPVGRNPNSNEAEEGLFQYNAVLDLDPNQFLSHAREVYGIKNMMCAPTLLESTSILFAFGHDVFGTQVAPSMTFDVLGKDFNRVQLILTVVGLYVGVVALRPIVMKKVVDRRWL